MPGAIAREIHMANRFTAIAFTPNVKAVQSEMGSRDSYGRHEQDPVDDPVLDANEISFIEARDSFYMASTGETGWPYVQHRGGPAGFLKVIDERTIGFADFSGNRQYISTGNLAGDDRVSLILVDYPRQARLKILGRVRIIGEHDDPGLLAQLENPHFRARVERGIVIRVEGFDWNCPKYITPRYTQEEVAALVRQAVAAHATEALGREAPLSEGPIGEGEIALTVSAIRQLTPQIRAYELRSGHGITLPAAEAGAHIEVPVRLADGALVTRQYSLASESRGQSFYDIAVLHEPDGRGGSAAIHNTWQLGTQLRIRAPINHFALHTDSRPAVLIAGGIGITPIKAMAAALKRRNVWFELHYTARTPEDMAYRDDLAAAFPANHFEYFSRAEGRARLEVATVLCGAPSDAVIYVCGPAGLIAAVRKVAAELNIHPGRIQQESFD